MIACLEVLARLGKKNEAEVVGAWFAEIRSEAKHLAGFIEGHRTRARPGHDQWRPLHRACKSGQLGRLLRDPNMAGALLYGARRAGLLGPSGAADDVDRLRELTPAQVRAAVDAALAPGSELLAEAGRPRDEYILWYARFLAAVYEEITGRAPGFNTDPYDDGRRSGPAIDFFRACLKPLRTWGTSGETIRRLVTEAVKQPRHPNMEALIAIKRRQATNR